MSTAQYLGLLSAILWGAGTAAPSEKEEVAVLTMFVSGGFCAAALATWAVGWPF